MATTQEVIALAERHYERSMVGAARRVLLEAAASGVLSHERAAKVARMPPAEWRALAGADAPAPVELRRVGPLDPNAIAALAARLQHRSEAALAAEIGISRPTLARAMLGRAVYGRPRAAIAGYLMRPSPGSNVTSAEICPESPVGPLGSECGA